MAPTRPQLETTNGQVIFGSLPWKLHAAFDKGRQDAVLSDQACAKNLGGWMPVSNKDWIKPRPKRFLLCSQLECEAFSSQEEYDDM